MVVCGDAVCLWFRKLGAQLGSGRPISASIKVKVKVFHTRNGQRQHD